MKVLRFQAQVDEAKCAGDKLCQTACPSGAVQVITKRAEVDLGRCVGCGKCSDICPHDAVTLVRLAEEKTMGMDPTEMEKRDKAINELCWEAGLPPHRVVCSCTRTLAKEIAAAVLSGARTPEEVTAMTGSGSGCGIYCLARTLTLLKHHLGELRPPKGHKWYDSTPSMWDVPPDVEEKHPESYLKEDRMMRLEYVTRRGARR